MTNKIMKEMQQKTKKKNYLKLIAKKKMKEEKMKKKSKMSKTKKIGAAVIRMI